MCGLLGLVEAKRRHRGVHVCQRNVLVEREFKDQTLTLAVLGQQCQTEFFRLLTGFDGNRLTLYLDLTAREWVCTEDGTHQLGTARTHQSVETGDLTCTSVERNALQRVALPDVGDFEQLFTRLYVNLGIIVGHFTSNHHGYHLIDGDVLDVYGVDVLAIAEDGQTIADLHNFFQSVGDVNDCYALLFQSVDNLEQAGNLLFG